MGTRINKAIGYGMVDITKAGLDVGQVFRTHAEISQWTPTDFWQWAVNNVDKVPPTGHKISDAHQEATFNLSLAKSAGKAKSLDLTHCCHLGEGDSSEEDFGEGDHNFMVLCPPGTRDWHRSDDSIDYIDASYFTEAGGICGPKAEVIPNCPGIFPYASSYTRLRPPPEGCPKPSDASSSIFHKRDADGWPISMDAGLYNMLTGHWDKGKDPLAEGLWLKHLQDDWAPRLPWEVAVLATKLGLTPEQQALLRPIRVTWWR